MLSKAKILSLSIFLFALSCNKNDDGGLVKEGKGYIWISGGLRYCAEQIHLDNGDTLVVDMKNIISFKTGDRVIVKYKEVGKNEFCPAFITSKIIAINLE
ncbi:MAG: hypothetical protein QM725_02760 [Lacibacter sp.]